MKTIRKKQIRIIEAQTGAECEERLNRVLDELYLNEPVLERDTTRSFCFYVTYIVKENVPESKADVYSLNGIDLRCSDCPHFVLPDDKRLGCRCGLTHGHVKATQAMCDDGYTALEEGGEK